MRRQNCCTPPPGVTFFFYNQSRNFSLFKTNPFDVTWNTNFCDPFLIRDIISLFGRRVVIDLWYIILKKNICPMSDYYNYCQTLEGYYITFFLAVIGDRGYNILKKGYVQCLTTVRVQIWCQLSLVCHASLCVLTRQDVYEEE
jgi:hypothetical protein